MLSKQKIKGLYNNQYRRSTKNKRADIERNSIMSGRVSITSTRIKNKKKWRIKLPLNNPLHKKYLYLNLNTIPRPNYRDGSKQMYRVVNGLCEYCGHNHYRAKITLSRRGYVLSNIYCTDCGTKQTWDIVYNYTNNNQRNRGKEYADRKGRKNNSKTHNY